MKRRERRAAGRQKGPRRRGVRFDTLAESVAAKNRRNGTVAARYESKRREPLGRGGSRPTTNQYERGRDGQRSARHGRDPIPGRESVPGGMGGRERRSESRLGGVVGPGGVRAKGEDKGRAEGENQRAALAHPSLG